jgi:hypothetical protein
MKMRIIALSLASLFFAHAATAQEPKSFARHLEITSRSSSHVATVSSLTTAFDVFSPPRIELARTAWTTAPGAQAGITSSLSFRHSAVDAFVAIRALPGDSQTPFQLMAAFGLRNFSFRVNSWRRLGSGPSVNAGTFSVARNVNLFQTGANTGFGLSLTMYRIGSRYEPVYRRRPVSVQFLFRVRFGSGAASLIGPVGRAKSL